MKTEIMTITPGMAKDWLARNTNNRRLRKWHITSLANAIRRGEWILTHQGIAFDVNGDMRDGQHRLAAIIEADTPVEMVVTFGIDEDAFKAIDNGVKRSISDLLGIHSRVADVVRLATSITFGAKDSTSQRVDEVGKCGFYDVSSLLIDTCGTARKYFSSAPWKLAAATRIIDGYDKDYILAQYKALILCDIDSMSISSKAALSQSVNGHISAADSLDTLARGLTVFDPSKANVSKIIVKESSPEIAAKYVKSVVRRCLSPHKEIWNGKNAS